jgi:ABC-type sugar transport system ATPase subunit
VLLKMNNISKSFFDVKVLENINFELQSGEVHALIGENGAGKSTLMKVLSGVYEADMGEIMIEQQKAVINSPLNARKSGIAIIHQEPALIANLSIAENIFLGCEPKLLKSFVHKTKMNKQAKTILKSLGYMINPNRLVKYLSLSEQHVVSIAKAISHQCKILIMDEPTASLSEYESNKLFSLIHKFKQEGVGVIYITHKLKEIHHICDRITILRDGKKVLTTPVNQISETEIIKHLVGRELTHFYPPIPTQRGSELLKVEQLTCSPWFEDISFQLFEGEILGIAGVVGSGKTEIGKALFGQLPYSKGVMYWKNKKVTIKNPSAAIKNKFGFINENRLQEGLFLDMSVSHNLTISHLKQMNDFQFVRINQERNKALEKIIDLDIKTQDLKQSVKYLSGGNQQKVLLGKWLVAESDIYILDEPTRGMDIGSKSELYVIIRELVSEGKAIIVLSSDFSELAGICSRVLVIHQGKLAAELNAGEATEEKIMHFASGVI